MIIVYGGTFNPPTKAHEKIANLIIEKYNPKKFIFLPVGDNYTWKDNFTSFKIRKEMLKLVFKDEIYEISSLENTKDYKGTYWALKQFKETYKTDVYFVMGADNLKELDKWINYLKLISEFKFIILTRKDYDALSLIKEKYINFLNNFAVINFDVDISSKEFRENPLLNEFLNENVFDYIKKNNLYEVNDVKA